MRIRTQFNIALIVVFGIGFALSAWLTYRVLLENSKQEVLRNAGLMMETALSVRSYTIDEIKPILNPLLNKTFLPQTVPAYAAVETFQRLRNKYPDFSYREATLNPTNPRNRSQDWESDVIERFRNGATGEIVGERAGENGPSLYIARPIKIEKPACLSCHSTPDAAPPELLVKYGSVNGFGWQMNDIVGAQIVTVPTGLAVRNAEHAFYAFSAVLGGLFVALFVLLNLMLSRMVVAPIMKVSELSDEISKGNLELPEFEETGADEIKHLHASFNRMRRSIEKAIKVVQLQKELIKKN
jgi:protein-histidine pros-kinase